MPLYQIVLSCPSRCSTELYQLYRFYSPISLMLHCSIESVILPTHRYRLALYHKIHWTKLKIHLVSAFYQYIHVAFCCTFFILKVLSRNALKKPFLKQFVPIFIHHLSLVIQKTSSQTFQHYSIAKSGLCKSCNREFHIQVLIIA